MLRSRKLLVAWMRDERRARRVGPGRDSGGLRGHVPADGEVLVASSTQFTVNVAPGTPLSKIPLPLKLVVLSETESCTLGVHVLLILLVLFLDDVLIIDDLFVDHVVVVDDDLQQLADPSAAASQGHPRGSDQPSRFEQPTAQAEAQAEAQDTSRSRSRSQGKAEAAGGSLVMVGCRRSSNPTFSFALPGSAPLGVPNFFIDSFRIPPFLLPIYQAAGIEYDVPWQVLAAINEIETDYGRNLSVSSAGAVGWMQFLPSTWKTWGVDANGDGVADPYNPVDAIFSAARYLHAAGASKELSRRDLCV